MLYLNMQMMQKMHSIMNQALENKQFIIFFQWEFFFIIIKWTAWVLDVNISL